MPANCACLTCTGVKWSEHNAASCPACRTCRFDNVCLNHTSLDIQYYLESQDIPLMYDLSGTPYWHFPPDFINTGMSFNYCLHVCIHNGVYQLYMCTLYCITGIMSFLTMSLCCMLVLTGLMNCRLFCILPDSCLGLPSHCLWMMLCYAGHLRAESVDVQDMCIFRPLKWTGLRQLLWDIYLMGPMFLKLLLWLTLLQTILSSILDMPCLISYFQSSICLTSWRHTIRTSNCCWQSIR